MSIKDSFHRQLPEEADVKYKVTIDGDRVPVSVTYPTESGASAKTVKVKQTCDGDRIPTTGYTIDGDHNYPDKKLDWM